MNLEATVDLYTPGKNESRTIEAGGPGSGRHKTEGVLQKAGYKQFKGKGFGVQEGDTAYTNGKRGQDAHVVVVHESGVVDHRPYGNRAGQFDYRDMSHVEFQKSIGKRLHAGGPGSGPQAGLSPEMRDLAIRKGRKLQVLSPHQPAQPKISLTPGLKVPGRLYKGGPAPKVSLNPALARPSAGGTGRAHGIRGGGPGSGRHPEAGKFVHSGHRGGGRFGRSSVFYKSPSGTQVSVQRKRDSVHVLESKPNSFMTTHVHEGNKESSRGFLKEHYGIDHKFSSPRKRND